VLEALAGPSYPEMAANKQGIARAAVEAGVRRVILTGGAAILPISAPLYKTVEGLPDWIYAVSRAHQSTLDFLTEHSERLDWSFLAPQRMTDDVEVVGQERFNVAYDVPAYTEMMRAVSFRDIADAVLARLDDRESFHKSVSFGHKD
jgi:putative NADH-flavin reductase